MFHELRDLGGFLFSVFTFLLIICFTVRAFMIHDRPGHPAHRDAPGAARVGQEAVHQVPDDEPHPLSWRREERVPTTRRLAMTSLEWKKSPGESDLVIAVIEL